MTLHADSLVKDALRASVLVFTSHGHGSGFFCEPDGHVVTNYHVVAGAREIGIRVAEGNEFTVSEIISFDQEDDIAVLRVPLTNAYRPTLLSLADDRAIAVGEPVLAIGNPQGHEQTVSDGIVSAIRRSRGRLQITAPISQGSSGGAILNTEGKVVGVAVEAHSVVRLDELESRKGVNVPQNLNFAVLSGVVRKHIDGDSLPWKQSAALRLSANDVTSSTFSYSGDLLYVGTQSGALFKCGIETGHVLARADRSCGILLLGCAAPEELFSAEWGTRSSTLHLQCWRHDRPCQEASIKTRFENAPHLLAWQVMGGSYIAAICFYPYFEGRNMNSVSVYCLKRGDDSELGLMPLWRVPVRRPGLACAAVSLPPRLDRLQADSFLIAAFSPRRLVLIRCHSGEPIREIETPQDIVDLAIDASGHNIFMLGSGGDVWLWHVFDPIRSQPDMRRIAQTPRDSRILVLAGNAKRIAAIGRGGTISVFDCL